MTDEDETPDVEEQAASKPTKRLISPRISELAKVFGFITAIITGITLIVSNSLIIKQNFFPKQEILVLKFNDRSDITLINKGDNGVFVSSLEYAYGSPGDEVTGFKVISEEVEPEKVLIFAFKDRPTNYGAVLKVQDVPENVGLSQIYDGPTQDGGCLIRVLATDTDTAFQRYSSSLGENLYTAPVRLTLVAYDLKTGERLDSSETVGLNGGQVFYVIDDEPCTQ